MKLVIPWSKETVDALNRYQNAGRFHPFTCGNDHGGKRELVATENGWICPSCNYTQDWAHDFMTTDEASKPFEWPRG